MSIRNLKIENGSLVLKVHCIIVNKKYEANGALKSQNPQKSRLKKIPLYRCCEYKFCDIKFHLFLGISDPSDYSLNFQDRTKT